MAIDAITAAGNAMRAMATSLPSLPHVGGAADGIPAGDAAGAAAGQGFGDKVVGAMEDLNALHANADQLAVQAATGDLSDVHEYTIAASQAEIATQLTVAVRDKAVEAFNDIMRMQF